MAVEGETGANGESGLTYEQSLARDRAAFMSGDDEDGGDGGDGEADTGKGDDSSDADDDSDLDDDAEESSSDAEDESEDAEDVDDDDSDLDEDEEPTKGKVDPKVAKSLEQVRRTEQRMRESMAKERQAFEAEQAQWKERLASAERFEQLRTRARHNPVAILSELGLTEDDFEAAAHELYAFSKKGAENPKLREAAARSRRERELASEVENLKKWREERELTDKQREQQAAAQRAIASYIDGVAKQATDRTPLAKQYLAKNPERARRDLEAIANRLADETGSVPDAKSVIKEFEKERRRILRDHGIDPKALHKTGTLKPDPKKAKANKAKARGEAIDEDDDKPLTFEEQRRRDREAFISSEFD